jgi:hypothetical protein
MFGFANPGAFCGPSQMLYLYKNMEVPVAGGIANVGVNNYRNANNSEDKGGCKAALEVKGALAQASRNQIFSYAGGGVLYMDSFVGKGSPWSIAGILEGFAVYSENYIKMFGKAGGAVGKVARILADDSITWEKTLQDVCDVCFGLDCNGFVGNWLMICAPEFKVTYNSRSNEVRRLRPKAIYRTDLSQIEYWDVMCYAGNEHIAAIDSRGTEPDKFLVCQSAGGGPRMNELMLTKVNGSSNKFKLAAPTPKDIGTEFYILNLWY